MVYLPEFISFRFLAGLISIIACVGLLRLVHKRKIAGYEFLIWSGILCLIFVLSSFPEIILTLSKYIKLSSTERYDRLFLVSFLFSFLTLSLVFYYRSKLDKLKQTFINSIQQPLVKKFVENTYNLNSKIEVLILIPAFNEETNLGKVLSRIPKKIYGFKSHVLVISDGSTDLTSKVAKDFKAMLVEHPTNFGQCMAYRTGYLIATNLGAKFVIHLDADGQYQPEEMELLFRPLVNDEADLVSGSRILGEYQQHFQKGHIIRSIGLKFFNIVLTLLTGKKITDSSSGFRAIKSSFLPMLTLKQDQFHSSELLLESIKNGARFKEVPITFLERISGDSKKPNTLRYAFGFFRTILKTWTRK